MGASLAHEQPLEGQPARQHHGFQRPHQRLDIGMVVAPIEGIEAIIEAAQADRVERQRRHVVDDVDLVVGVEPLPFLDELVGDIDHHRMVGLHGAIAEGGQQDVMRLAPVRLLRVGREQSIARERADAPQRPPHGLVEPRGVAEFVDEIGPRDDHHRRAHHVEPEDRPQLLGEPRQMLRRRLAVDGEHVADERRARRMRNRRERIVGRHIA